MKFSRSSILALAATALLAVPTYAATSTGTLTSAAASDSEAAAASSTNTATDTGSNTDSATTTQTGSSVQSTTVATTSGSASSSSGSVSTITGSSSSTGSATSSLPTLSSAYTIVAPSVPPTADAPYMQVSKLPEGTVFIIVGAFLGFLAISVLLWRTLVAWSLHRSVKRAAAAQYTSDTKAHFRAPSAPFYKYSDRDSTISLGALGAKNAKKGARQSTAMPSGTTASSLFFSPTAGAAGAGGLANAGNRGSSYLPAGYYAAGAAQPGNGQGMSHIGQSHSLSNLVPGREGYSRARSLGTSPPDSPSLRPQSSGLHGYGHSYGASSSTLNLNGGGEGRAPSAVLDDFFDGDNAPPAPGHEDPRRY